MESCPSWSKEHDWKSCKSLKRLRGFESLALRHTCGEQFAHRSFFTAKMPAFAMDIYFVNISHLTESGRNLRSGLSFYFAFCLRLQWVSVLSTLPIVKAAISFKDCGFLILFIYITRLKQYNKKEII